VAIVHDFLYCYAGAERVLEQMIELFPQADLFSLFDFVPIGERDFLKGKRVRTTVLQRMPFAKQKHRAYLPLMPLAVEQLDVSDYDVILSSSYLSAKGVITAPHQLHVCYCHSPVRFAWDQQHQYLEQAGLKRGIKSVLARVILHYIRGWDVRSANNVDVFLTNSHFVRRRVERIYRREASTVHPPVNVERFALCEEKEDFYVTVSRMVPYKRMDLIVEAFGRMPSRRLVVIGDGPEMKKIRRLAKGNVELMGQQSDAVVGEKLGRARGFVFAAEEDFGIAPVEAQACGTPVIAFGRGGVTESVIPGKTGIFFGRQQAGELCRAVEAFERHTWDARAIRKHAEMFSAEVFRRNFRAVVEEAWERFQLHSGEGVFDMREAALEAEGRDTRDRDTQVAERI